MGAISTACQPARHTAAIATAATAVLPLPTSPCSRRRIGSSAGKVLEDLVEDRDVLVLGQRERERRLERAGLVTRHLDARRSLARAGSARLRQYELQREELIVREPIEGRPHLAWVIRKMRRLEGRGQAGQPLSLVLV